MFKFPQAANQGINEMKDHSLFLVVFACERILPRLAKQNSSLNRVRESEKDNRPFGSQQFPDPQAHTYAF